jgi:hypothetical protein
MQGSQLIGSTEAELECPDWSFRLTSDSRPRPTEFLIRPPALKVKRG